MFTVAAGVSVKTSIQIAASFTSRFSPFSFFKSPSSSSSAIKSNTVLLYNTHFDITTLSVSIPIRQSRCYSAMATTHAADDTTMDAVQRRLMFDDEYVFIYTYICVCVIIVFVVFDCRSN